MPTNAPLDAHDAALQRLLAHGPEFGDGLSNHGPMVVEALGAMQRSDAITDWLAGYRPNLEPAPAPGVVIDAAAYAARLGDRGAYADWEATFTHLLQERNWQNVVADWQPVLLPGFAAALAHGVIRVGHAVRALATTDTPLRRQELARALAYQAANRRAVLGEAGAVGEAHLDLARIPLLPAAARSAATGPSEQRLAAVLAHEPFGIAAANGDPRDTRTFHLDLLEAIARQFVRHGADAPIFFLHAFTAAAALSPLWPWLDEPMRALGCRQAWRFAAAVQCRFASERHTPPAIDAAAWPEDLVDAAVADGDEHKIKLTSACFVAWRTRPSPAFVAAARRSLTLW